MLYPEFFGNTVLYTYCELEWNIKALTIEEKNRIRIKIRVFSIYIDLTCISQPGQRFFYKLCSKKFGLNI